MPSRIIPSRTHYDWFAASHVEAELHHVAVLHHVVLALDPRLTAGTRFGHRTGVDQVLVRDHLGLDEALLEVGVDDPGCLGRRGALPDRPGPGLFGTSGEERLEPERAEADMG